ncbi:MAG: c-type cytochrome [Hyphomicrobium sp.]|nr:MAG: c-type cytochrome [Hyphomicrobium sp.]MBZ0209612.1 c-type cytochrome [Hyphomicrobium sp.]
MLSALALSTLFSLTTVAPAAAVQEESDGKVAFNNACRTCHSFKAGDNRLGPTLHGVVGRKAGSIEGFQFSAAMKSSGITWDESNLDKFIANPDTVVHGNAMKPFGGVADASEREKIVEYLKTLK